MSSMSRNNSTAALMGFSISQPALGAPLQFFPALGSKELDDLISAYVPGNAHITEKRAAVSMEFFQNAMVTGEYFKFFMVPAFASVAPSPAMDSGYGSSFAASPASQTTSFSSPNMSTPRDYSNVPGMRIMTKDGRDVTNLSSRGCKTKEQRDHAHLMRIIKACDACRKKKVKCDPSHKRPAAGSSGKVTKKASKNSRSAPMSKPAVVVPELKTSETPSSSGSSPSIPLDTVDEGVMDWDQFIKYDDEPLDSIPVDYDFFMDPAGYFSPAGTSATLTSSNTSPSQLPPTPIDDLSGEVHPGTAIMDEESNAPMLPYLSDNGLVSASNYVDFDLFSPPASPFLNEELSMARELSAASPRPNFAGRVIQQSPPPPHGRHRDEYTDDNSRHNPDNAVADSVNIAPGLHLQSTSLSPLAITSYDVSHGGYQDMSTFRHQSPSVQAVSHAMSHGVNAPATGASFNGVQVNSGSYEGVNAIEAQSHPEYQRGVVPLATSSLSDSRNRNTAAASGVTVPREERRSASGLLVAAGANHEAMAPALPGATSFDAFTRFTSSPENAEMIATEPERLSLHQPIVSSNGVLSTSAAQRCTSDDVSRLYERESIYTGTPTRTDTGTAVQHATPQTHVARSTIARNSRELSSYQTVQLVDQANGMEDIAVSAFTPQGRLEGVRFDPRRIAATQPIVSTQQDQLAGDPVVSSTFVLLLCLAALVPFAITSVVLMAAMTLGVAWPQRHKSMRMSCQKASHFPSSTIESKATGSIWNQFYIDSVVNFKNASVKLERTVRCGLGQRLQGWMSGNGFSASSAPNSRKQTKALRRNCAAI